MMGYNEYLTITLKNNTLDSGILNRDANDFTPEFGLYKNDKSLRLLIGEKIISEHNGKFYIKIDNNMRTLFVELPTEISDINK